jgi:hypothetical protein
MAHLQRKKRTRKCKAKSTEMPEKVGFGNTIFPDRDRLEKLDI